MNSSVKEAENWSARAVSWGHLLLALAGTLLSVGAIIVANEQRVTRLEVRLQQAVDDNRAQDERYYRTVAARNAEYAALRSELANKLDRIETELTGLKIAISSHSNNPPKIGR